MDEWVTSSTSKQHAERETIGHNEFLEEDTTEPMAELHESFGRRIRFGVYWKPAPQGSTKAFIVKGKAVITSTSKNLKAWRDLVMQKAQEHTATRFEGPVAVTLRFYLERPKSAPKRRRTYPDRRPDLDKLVRAVLDAITPVVIKDDSQVVSLTATKDYGVPGVEIQVDEIKV